MAEYQINTNETGKKKSSLWKYILYMAIVLIATAISLVVSLWGDSFNQVIDAFSKADWRYVLVVFGIVAITYLIEGLIILIFCRLYTRKYRFHQGLACSLVGQFYSNVTPGASGGQVMQAYTMKSQGIRVSNAASIMVMWFILYQTALILFGLTALCFEWRSVMSLSPHIVIGDWRWDPPMWPLILIGFALNLSVIGMLFFMSYSHHFHNFILHYVIGFLGKIHILKKPDQARESLRVQVENFKIELRRLQSNIPVLLLLLFLFFFNLFLRFSIPYFCGFAMHAYGEEAQFVFASFDGTPSMVRASFFTAFHQMVTGLFPLPGSAGISELFYNLLFEQTFFGVTTTATQILWRTATFHIVLIVSGIVSAFYHSRGGADVTYASHKTYVTLQLETYDERKRSADTSYVTAQYNRKEFQRKFSPRKNRDEDEVTLPHGEENYSSSIPSSFMTTQTRQQRFHTEQQKATKQPKPEKPKKKKKKGEVEDGWDNWEL